MRCQTPRVPIPILTAGFTFLAPCLAQAHRAEFIRDKPVSQRMGMAIDGLDRMLVATAATIQAGPLVEHRNSLL